MNPYRKVRVLIVDDSAMVRKVLAMGLAGDPGLDVVGQASSAEVARAMMIELRPDVVTLDLEMPDMDGLTFLRSYMPAMPVPTVIISALTRSSQHVILQAMQAGAVDVISKPKPGVGEGLTCIMQNICARVLAAAGARVGPALQTAQSPATELSCGVTYCPGWIHAIGASTGGVQALSRILPHFPVNSPAILIVQHMPEGFTAAFATRLDQLCQMNVREAKDGDLVERGVVLLSPGGSQHMVLRKHGQEFRLAMIAGDPVCYSRPSVDVLFQSIASLANRSCSAALLTGMGRDGAAGLLAIRKAGGRSFAQDEASSVVFGMPLAAWELGAAEALVPLDDIPRRLALAAIHAPAVLRPARGSLWQQSSTEFRE